MAEAPEVSLVSDPAPSVLLGRFEEGKIILANPELDGVRPEEVTIDLEPFELDVPASVASGRVESEGPLSGMLRAELSEEEVARLANSSDDLAAPVSGVRLEEGYLVVGSEVEALGARVPAGVEGDLALRDGDLLFDPRRLKVLGRDVPEPLTRRLLEDADFAYPIELPFEGEVSGVEVHEERLVLIGEVRDLAVG
ncbi:MAG: hypothetical protein AVDCRST_MAG80-246 [uncultured Rubrobacteraceae bacterium]|uniref:DUF2993 domain-containing protein n=1 Tax=uncultured Rubrobacteraceae bacterium TaxID=349277 RepID=A0A6J4PWJ0_9ACTN|nr:MAG: hypothetical protein AVDCRST_MAG80-246 [uncultured Rubrobacteraceae bacterium]